MSSSHDFTWTEYLDLAGELVTSPRANAVEASLRSGISRAYYAAFHAAKDFLATSGSARRRAPPISIAEQRETGGTSSAAVLEKAARGALLLAGEIVRQIAAMRR